jgi:DNA-binding CsgD family transcriptional regulator
MPDPRDPLVDAALSSAPPGLRVSRFRVGDEEIAVLTVPVAPLSLPASLSPAEREVACELLRGRSNAQIAAARGTSARTVANQVNAILRKCGADSRGTLNTRHNRPIASR